MLIGGKVVELSADENGEIVEHEVECPNGYTCKESNPGVCSLI